MRRLISPEYLVVGEPGPLGGLWVLYAALGLLFAAGLGAALWVLWGPDRARAGSQSGAAAQPKDTRSTVAWAWFELWVCLAGLGTVIGRFLGWPGWSARIWPYSLAALAIAGALAYRFRRVQLPPWLIAQFRVLALRPAPVERPTRGGWLALGAAVHLAGVGLIVTGRFGWPLWTALPALLVLLLPQVPLGFRRIPVRRRAGPLLMALTPLWGAYAATLLWLLYHAWGITVIGWQGLAFPNPMTSLFYVDGVLLAAVAYTWLCQVSVVAAHAHMHARAGSLTRRTKERSSLRPGPATPGKPAGSGDPAGARESQVPRRRFEPMPGFRARSRRTTVRRKGADYGPRRANGCFSGRKPCPTWRWAVIGLLAVTLAWAGVVYFGKRTHGATASDPYAYAQMGVDLAERGTFLHRFSLFQTVIPLGIAWAPLQPVGYHIPRNDLGDCPSVWATGASVLLAAGYRLLGETGLYVTTPIVALLALAATWALVQETLRGESAAVRHLTAALTVALLATSPEHVDRLLVPMADAAAQLFTVLTLWFLLRGVRRSGKWGWVDWGLAGLCLGWAYWVRHTQLVLFVPAFLALSQSTNSQSTWTLDIRLRKSCIAKACDILACFSLPIGRNDQPETSEVYIRQLFQSPKSTNRPISRLVVLLTAAAIAAAPDIAYRWRVFGGPLATETTELHLMSLRHIGPVAWQMLREALVAGEWGYLFPLVLYGAYRLARERRREAAILGSAFAAVLLVHLTYRSLRLRDLISLFPLVDLAAAYGAVALVRRVRRITQGREARLGAALLPAATLAWVILSLALSRWAMIDNLWKPGWASFGYMRAEQRAAFDRLAELTPPEAVIGASLNAGAVMMYTGRDAVRPYDSWTDEEWGIFLAAMEAEGRPIYLLDDGGLMAAFIEQEQARRRLTPIAELQIPLFYTQGRESGWLYRLETGD